MTEVDNALAPPGYDRHRSEAGTAEPPKSSGGADSRSVPSPIPADLLLAAAERVMRRVRATETGCLIWQGAFTATGTAIVGVRHRSIAITRVMWFARHGEYPTWRCERTCGDTRCVNVDHLRPSHGFSEEDTFWRGVDTNGPLHPYDATLGHCWDWTGARYASGYGKVYSRAAGRYAHRLSLLLATGRPLTPGMYVLHSCDRPCCVNPAHLREGTPRENLIDREERFYGRERAS